MKKSASIDMINGPLAGKILLFSLPLMASNILQFLFNAADVVVVGRYAGHVSLAAVGSTTSLISLFTMLPLGLSIGVNMLIARFLGHGNKKKETSDALHTSMSFALIGGVVLTVIGLLTAGLMMDITGVPADVYDLAKIYVKIYSLAFPAIMIYNCGAGALRAKGDTRWPLLFLMISGVVNVILNLIFVIVFGLDVAGVALATVVSQYLSALLITAELMHSTDELKYDPRRFVIDKKYLKQIAVVGVPAAIQSCLFSISNIAIQSAINSYSSETIAAMSAASSIENFIYISMNAFHHACQTFGGQNMAAGKYDRVISVVRISVLFAAATGIAEGFYVAFNGAGLISIYNSNPEVIRAGVPRLIMTGTTYFAYGISDVLVGALRGIGMPIAPVVINLCGAVVLRLIWIGILDTSKYPVEWVVLSYPVSWFIIALVLGIFWLKVKSKKISPMLRRVK